MIVTIVSDTHGTIAKGILDLIECADLCVHAGDVGNASVLKRIEALGTPVLAVVGNNDVPGKWPVSDHEVLNQLPDQHVIDLPGGRLCVEHGHRVNPAQRRHAKLRAKFPEAKAVVYGHSHRPVSDRETRPWILNPGAAGHARTYGGASCIRPPQLC